MSRDEKNGWRGRAYPPEVRHEAVELYRSSGKSLRVIAEELGSQYVPLAFSQQARDAGIAVSMGSKGD